MDEISECTEADDGLLDWLEDLVGIGFNQALELDDVLEPPTILRRRCARMTVLMTRGHDCMT